MITIRSSALMNNRAGEVSLGHAAWITPPLVETCERACPPPPPL